MVLRSSTRRMMMTTASTSTTCTTPRQAAVPHRPTLSSSLIAIDNGRYFSFGKSIIVATNSPTPATNASRTPPAIPLDVSGRCGAQGSSSFLKGRIQLCQRRCRRTENQRPKSHKVSQRHNPVRADQHLSKAENRRPGKGNDQVECDDGPGQRPRQHHCDIDNSLPSNLLARGDVSARHAENKRSGNCECTHLKAVPDRLKHVPIREHVDEVCRCIRRRERRCPPGVVHGECEEKDHCDRKDQDNRRYHCADEEHQLGRRARQPPALSGAAF